MSAGEETIYRCDGCEAVLVITSVPSGVLRAVYCRRCGARRTVYLGGRREVPPGAPATAPGLVTIGDGDPANPPIETRTVVPRTRRRRAG